MHSVWVCTDWGSRLINAREEPLTKEALSSRARKSRIAAAFSAFSEAHMEMLHLAGGFVDHRVESKH